MEYTYNLSTWGGQGRGSKVQSQPALLQEWLKKPAKDGKDRKGKEMKKGKGKKRPSQACKPSWTTYSSNSGSYLLEVQFTHYNRAENSVVTRDSLRYSSTLWWCWSKEIHCAASHIKTQRMWQHVVYSMWLWQWTAMLLNCRYTITIFSSVLILNLL